MQLPDLSLLLIMVLFWATYAALRAWVFKPLGAILEEREKKAASATDALGKALENEKETLASIDRRLTEARREALAARQAARAELARNVRATAGEIASLALGRSVA